MTDISWADKSTGGSGGTAVFTASDANQIKTAVNSKADLVDLFDEDGLLLTDIFPPDIGTGADMTGDEIVTALASGTEEEQTARSTAIVNPLVSATVAGNSKIFGTTSGGAFAEHSYAELAALVDPFITGGGGDSSYTAPTTTVAAIQAILEATNNGTNKVNLTGPTLLAADVTVTFQGLTSTVYQSGGTDIPITDGGTGASTASAARTNLGVAIGSDVQAYNANLASAAGLTLAANKGLYATGVGTFDLYDLTVAGRALGGVSGAADKGVYFTSSSAVAIFDLTEYARSFTAATTAAAAATLLGLGTGDSPQLTGINVGHASDTTITRAASGVIAVEGVPLYSNVPQNSQSAAYTLVIGDAQKHILHPSADTTARIWTIPANASVAFPIGTAVTFVNQNAGGVITISITSDTLRLAGTGATGSRSLAANGMATALKMTTTEWIISGTGLT